jgi:DNA-binding MarR family transcriptional regulator
MAFRQTPDKSISALLHRVWQLINLAFQTATGNTDLTLPRYIVLHAVSQEDGLSQHTITARTGMDRSTVSMLVRKLVARGWLRSGRAKSDRRRYALQLTAAGWKALHAGAVIVERLDAEILNAPLKNKQAWIDDLALVVRSLRTNRETRVLRQPRDTRASKRPLGRKPRH